MHDAITVAAFPEFGLFADLDEAVVAADADTNIMFANAAAERLLGWSAPDLFGRPIETLVSRRLIDERRPGFAPFTQGDTLRFTGQPIRVALVRKDGQEVETDVVLSALERAGRQVVVATVRPVDTHAALDDPIAAADDLIAVLRTGDGFSVAMNRLVATLGRRLGFDFAALWVPDERIERLRCIAVWETAPSVFPAFTRATRDLTIEPNQGLPGRAWASGVPVWTPDLSVEEGTVRAEAAMAEGLCGGVVFPVVADHEVVGVIELYSMHSRDVDSVLQRSLVRVGAELAHVLHRRLIAEASKLERARLELALDAGAMGVWHWDIGSNVVTWSENVQALLGREGEFVGTIDDFTAVVHADDRDRVIAAFVRILEPASSRELHIEYRVMADDGATHWIETRGRALADDTGALVAVTGVSTDITERKEGELARETSHARLDLALEAGRMGVWDWNPQRDEVHLSVTLQLEYGFPPRATFEEISAFVHPDDRDRVAARVADSIRRSGRFHTEARVVRPDGQVRWVANRGLAMRDADGNITAMTGVATDVTEQRLATANLRRKSRLLETLNDVGRAVTSNLELDQVVQMVTDAATELTGAAFGAFFYNVPDGQGGHYMLYTISGAPAEAFASFPMPRNTPLFDPTFSGTGVVRLDDVTKDPRYGQVAPHHGMPKGHLPVRSYLAVPVVGGDGEVYGGLFFGHGDPRRFTESSEALAVGIAAQAAVAIANARLFTDARDESAARQRAYEERDAVARALQRSLLSPALPESRHFEFGARYAAGREMVGGDFYDVFPLGGRSWGLVLGDVCGKGPEAAAVTGLTRYTVRSAAVLEAEAGDVLSFLNGALLRDPAVDRFCSAVFARLDVVERGTVKLQMAHGGHPPALVLRANGTVEAAGDTGMLLGIVREPRVAHSVVPLNSGDSVVLYTDGVTEAHGADGPFGFERLLALVPTLVERSPQEIADAVVDAARAHLDRLHRDDMAVLVATVR